MDTILTQYYAFICIGYSQVIYPVIGNVCMDMAMVDITGIEAEEGDEVIIFGKEWPILQMAKQIGTIPYELLTGVSERVKRIFYAS
jgi:Alr-MurF fusion protein